MHMNFLFSRWIPTILAFLLLLHASACQKNVSADYSTDDFYQAVFTEEDDQRTKDLKNVICAHLDAYNTGDAETYFSLFDMERNDIRYNINQFNMLRTTADLQFQPEAIHTAFINDDNAQVVITMVCSAESLQDRTLLYKYRTELSYIMVRTGKTWKVTLQTPGAEEDLMNLEEQTETEAVTEPHS